MALAPEIRVYKRRNMWRRNSNNVILINDILEDDSIFLCQHVSVGILLVLFTVCCEFLFGAGYQQNALNAVCHRTKAVSLFTCTVVLTV